jgi:hypothetical protein
MPTIAAPKRTIPAQADPAKPAALFAEKPAPVAASKLTAAQPVSAVALASRAVQIAAWAVNLASPCLTASFARQYRRSPSVAPTSMSEDGEASGNASDIQPRTSNNAANATTASIYRFTGHEVSPGLGGMSDPP